MSTIAKGLQGLRNRVVAFIAIALSVSMIAVACGGGGGDASDAPGISPEAVADYIHTVMAADRTAYTKHVIQRTKTLEGKDNSDGVLDIEATEGWQQTDGIPLPAQMFRLGSEIANEMGDGAFTYNLISPWYINDSHEPKNEFEKTAMDAVIETGESYKEYQEVGGQKFLSALYPDIAVVESCATCHNTHPIHLERYPDKVFKLDDVMGGVIINIPLDDV